MPDEPTLLNLDPWWDEPACISCGTFPRPGQAGYARPVLLLAALIAFVAEHRRCDELDGGLDGGYVWMTCSCGAGIAQPV